MNYLYGVYAISFSELQAYHADATRRGLEATAAMLMRRLDELRPSIRLK